MDTIKNSSTTGVPQSCVLETLHVADHKSYRQDLLKSHMTKAALSFYSIVDRGNTMSSQKIKFDYGERSALDETPLSNKGEPAFARN